MKKKLFVPFLCFYALFAVGIYGLTKGIKQVEVWRIILASIGLMIGVFLFYRILKKKTFIEKKEKS